VTAEAGPVLLAGLVTAAAVMVLAALVARAQGRVAVVDVAWGAGFVLVALATAVVAQLLDSGDGARRWLLVALVAIWGLRLAWHIRRRAVGHGDDPRYETLLGGPLAEVGLARAVRKVFAVQGAAMAVVSAPVAVGAVSDVAWWPVVWVGVVVWATGVAFETIGDAQLAAYKQDPARPPVMDRGLWAWTRHPNYFGDACVWWGLWLAGGLASGWLAGLLTLVAPVAMTYFLVFATGARLLEQSMMRRDGYPAYAARTSMFIPLPPPR
jgi:steroid 5-alpha reductase family enzyme